MKQLQTSMDDASNRLVQVETVRSQWVNPAELNPQLIPQQLDQLKVKYDHIFIRHAFVQLLIKISL